MAFQEEDPATSSRPVYVQRRELLRAFDDREQGAITLAERGSSLSTHAEARNLSNELFRMVDKDNSGKISPSEFDSFKLIVAEVSAELLPDRMSELDLNDDGEVDADEWTKRMDAVMRSMGPDKFVDTCFRSLSRVRDAFGDGSRLHPWIDIDFSSLGRERRKIVGADKRGITAPQLRKLLDFMDSHTDSAGYLLGWWDRFTLKSLELETINLYAVADWIIKPFTAKATCSYVELVVDEGTVEQRPQWFISHWWGEPVHDFVISVETKA